MNEHNDPHHDLSSVLSYIVDFGEAQLDSILSCFRPKSIKRNELLLSHGEVCKEFYYVRKGCLRTYFLDDKGREKTRYIIHDCSIGTALTSFITQQPSVEFIEALEDTDILAIRHADFYRLNGEMDAWKQFYQRILEMAYTFQNRRIEELVTLSAKQRYDQFARQHPRLVYRISNRVLASYLDITQETLSRMKSR